MNRTNFSQPASGAEHSAFQSAQSALARKPLPGPRWAWPVLGVVAIAGVAFLVTGTSGDHPAHRAPAPEAAESASAEAPPPTPAPAPAPDPAPPAAAANPPAATASPAANDSAPAAAATEPAKSGDASDDAVASAPAGKKKKARSVAQRANRKRATRTN